MLYQRLSYDCISDHDMHLVVVKLYAVVTVVKIGPLVSIGSDLCLPISSR
jgi:hypothetical protein